MKFFYPVFYSAIAAMLTIAACVTINEPYPCRIGGAGGRAVTTSSVSVGSGLDCPLCVEAMLGQYQADELCPASTVKFNALFACACVDTCAAVCVIPDMGDAGDGATCGLTDPAVSTECKVCLVNATGCGAAWDACVNDDGLPQATATTSTGLDCSCALDVPQCPGGSWECTSPGDYTHGPSCGSASFCEACCDPTDACSIRGSCAVTKVADMPCLEDYECCSGVCQGSACLGGCGVSFSLPNTSVGTGQ